MQEGTGIINNKFAGSRVRTHEYPPTKPRMCVCSRPLIHTHHAHQSPAQTISLRSRHVTRYQHRRTPRTRNAPHTHHCTSSGWPPTRRTDADGTGPLAASRDRTRPTPHALIELRRGVWRPLTPFRSPPNAPLRCPSDIRLLVCDGAPIRHGAPHKQCAASMQPRERLRRHPYTRPLRCSACHYKQTPRWISTATRQSPTAPMARAEHITPQRQAHVRSRTTPAPPTPSQA